VFKHFLLPTDGSPMSEVAVRMGIQFAKTIHARVTGLCVTPKLRYVSYDSELSAEVRKRIAEACQAQAEKSLSAIETSTRQAGVPCDTAHETNDFPYEAIVRVAQTRGCDLILMASHSRRGVESLLLGSETQKVLTHSKIPVLVYRGTDLNPKEVGMFTHILLPTDGSSLSKTAIQKGIQFAKTVKAKVTGLSVMPEWGYSIYESEVPGKFKDEAAAEWKSKAEETLSALSKAAKEAGVPCDIVLETSDQPYEVIINTADKKRCDLIMMASHGRRGVGALLIGSETQKVLTHSKIPVLVYR
jgi:nucleotide-binding universal stress UspA family protein